MTNEQILLGLLGLVITIMVGGLGSFMTLFFVRKKNGDHTDPAGSRSTDFWLRQFDKLIEAQVRCETRQDQVIERLDKLIGIMETKWDSSR